MIASYSNILLVSTSIIVAMMIEPCAAVKATSPSHFRGLNVDHDQCVEQCLQDCGPPQQDPYTMSPYAFRVGLGQKRIITMAPTLAGTNFQSFKIAPVFPHSLNELSFEFSYNNQIAVSINGDHRVLMNEELNGTPWINIMRSYYDVEFQVAADDVLEINALNGDIDVIVNPVVQGESD